MRCHYRKGKLLQLYVVDAVLLAESEEDLNRIVGHYNVLGDDVQVNTSKTKILDFERNGLSQHNIGLYGCSDVVNDLRYLKVMQGKRTGGALKALE